jgi:hypothetical protein
LTDIFPRIFIPSPMPNWLLRAGKMILVLTLVVSLGGHHALLQTIAWGNMFVTFSSQDSFSEAVEKTFDGKHPCELCKVVEKSKESEERKPLLKAEMKMEIALPAPVRVPFPRSTDVVILTCGYVSDFTEVYLALPMRPPRAV